jgi:plasmid stability protein
VAAFHLRNIPPELYERLRERAARDGRSINAEILSILERNLSVPSEAEFERRLAELHSRWRLSPDAPTPEELIRKDRDSH